PGDPGPRSNTEHANAAAAQQAFKAWVAADSAPGHLRSPLILRLVHARVLTQKQRQNLFDTAKAVYTEQVDNAKAESKAAEDPVTKAVADFDLAHAKAALKLLDTVSAN